MKNFLEKWNNDQKYQVKIKLSLYTAFVVLVSIIAISSRGQIPTNEIDYTNNSNVQNNEVEQNEQINLIEIPEEYNYKIEIKINENKYIYKGTKEQSREIITKEINNVTEKYIYENNQYYKQNEVDYNLTEENEIYDIIDPSFIKIQTINKYLSKSKKMLNQHIVYLKDIILGNDSEKYIIIELNKNIIEIDYTELMNQFNKNINKYLVKIELEKIE